MANGHSPNKPPLQGSFGPVHTSQPKTSGVPGGKGSAPKSTRMKPIHPKGIGGSKKK